MGVDDLAGAKFSEPADVSRAGSRGDLSGAKTGQLNRQRSRRAGRADDEQTTASTGIEIIERLLGGQDGDEQASSDQGERCAGHAAAFDARTITC